MSSWANGLAHEAFRGHPDDRQVVPTGSNAVGTRCCASDSTAKSNHGVFHEPAVGWAGVNRAGTAAKARASLTRLSHKTALFNFFHERVCCVAMGYRAEWRPKACVTTYPLDRQAW